MSNPVETNYLRGVARETFLYSLKKASVSKAFARHVNYSRGVLRICDDLFQVGNYSRLHVASFGKCAHTMTVALADELGELAGGIACVPESKELASQVKGFRYFHGGLPYPNAESVRAAKAILKSIHGLDGRALILYLISGGTSLAEQPADEEITLPDLIETYRGLEDSGAEIAEINPIRKYLSAFKGGRLAEAAAGHAAQQVSIMISDAPENALDSVASGPTMPDSSSDEDCYRIAAQYDLLKKFPSTVRELFERRALMETPDKDDPAFHNCRWWPILSNADVLKAAASKSAEAGFAVEIDNTCDGWDYAAAADYLLNKLRELRRIASRVCLISGGEVTVKLDEKSVRGCRNHFFALHCATKISGENIIVLSADTEGIDGDGPAAGAIVDGATRTRLCELRLREGRDALLNLSDPSSALEKTGDALITGRSGNSVRDLRILMAY